MWISLYSEPIPPWIKHWSLQVLLAQTPGLNRINPRIKGWVYTVLEVVNKLLFIQSCDLASKVQNQLLLRGEKQDPAVLAAAQTGSKETWKSSRICLRPFAPRGLWGIRRSQGGERGLKTLKPLKFKSCQRSTSSVLSKKKKKKSDLFPCGRWMRRILCCKNKRAFVGILVLTLMDHNRSSQGFWEKESPLFGGT